MNSPGNDKVAHKGNSMPLGTTEGVSIYLTRCSLTLFEKKRVKTGSIIRSYE